MELARATWTEVDGTPGRVLLVPAGSCEQHGPHLPLDTDTRVAVAVAARVAERRDDVIVAPPVAYGASGEHQAFPGTLSMGTETLVSVVVELGRSALPAAGPRPYRAMVVVNGHGGNLEAITRAVDVLVGEGRRVASWTPRIPGGDGHAGRAETSMLLALDPAAVRGDRPRGNVAPLSTLAGELRARGVRALSESGVLGDAAGATAEEGHRILSALVDDLEQLVTSVTHNDLPGAQHDNPASGA